MNEGGMPINSGFDEKALGRAIQNARRSAGMTQQELCEKLDISYSTLTKIERGAIKAPSIFTVAQIAQICGTSIESLIGIQPLTNTVAPALNDYKISKSGISFVYFDINGCMVRFFQRAFSELATDTGSSPELVEETFWHYNDAVCRGEMSMADFNLAMAKGIGANTVDWMSYYLRAVEPISELQEFATWVSQNYRIGLLSNIMPGHIDAMLAEGLIPKLPYSAVVDSSVVGAIKPESEIYEAAQKIANVPPQEILLVDDARTNLMSAERLGWHVLWFDDFRPDESVERIRSNLEF